jgi:hypothetical protein
VVVFQSDEVLAEFGRLESLTLQSYPQNEQAKSKNARSNLEGRKTTTARRAVTVLMRAAAADHQRQMRPETARGFAVVDQTALRKAERCPNDAAQNP